MKRLILGLFAAALGGLLGAGATRPAASPGGPLFVSPTGSDSNPCTEAAPCLTFGRAYQVASPGDTVLVTCGGAAGCSYPAQSITYPLAKQGSYRCRAAETFTSGQTTKDDASGCITFRAPAGVVPAIASAAIEVPYVQLDGLTFSQSLFAGTATGRIDKPCSTWNVHDLIFRNVEAAGFVFNSVSYTYVIGGSYGPLLNDASKVEPCNHGEHTGGSHVAIDGVTMHDYRQTQRSAHMECIHFQQGQDSLIVRSRFLNCAQQGLSVQTQHGSTIDGLLIENNVFDAACSHADPGDVCGVVSGGTTTFICNATGERIANVTMQYNTLNGSPSFQRQQSCSMDGITVRGNILAGPLSDSCPKQQAVGVVYAYNAFTNAGGVPCGVGNVLGASVASTWVNPAQYDYRLKPESRPVELVPQSQPQPSTDIDGNLRPLRWPSDAGAYQRETALVVLGRSIGAASIGEKRSGIIAFFGEPQRTGHSRSGRHMLSRLVYELHGGLLWVTLEHGHVVGIGTTSPYYATRAGVGPAASAAGLRSRTRVTWVRCRGAFRRHFGRVVVQFGLVRGQSRIATVSMANIGTTAECR